MLALAGVSLLGVLIAGVAYRVSSGPAFEQLIIDQGEEGFIGNVILYYRESGTVENLSDWLRPRVYEPPDGVTVRPGDPRPGGLVRYGLADASGVVALQGGLDWDVGQPVPPAELAKGRPVYVDGKLIGTVLVPSTTRSPTTALRRRTSGASTPPLRWRRAPESLQPSPSAWYWPGASCGRCAS